MYKYLFSLLIIAGLFNSCGPTHIVVEEHPYRPAPPPPPPPQEAPYQEFYDQLAPYGQWIDYPGYGYVFMPNAGPDFKPYSTNGHWVYTDEGWAWASEYNWGWAAFHYGRWFFEDGYGWMWIPGHEWAPAWVSWRRSPDYYGWAPLGPGVSINVSIGGGYNPPAHYWSFVQPQYITHPHVNNYYVNESRNVTIINNTTVINNTVINNNVNNTTINNHVHNNYAGGPDTHEVERMTGAPVRPVAIQENNRPGEQLNNNQLAIYRPRGNAGQPQNAAMKPAPPAVVHLNQARPATTIRYNNGSYNNGGAPMQNNAPTPPQHPNNNNGFNRPGNPINNNNTTVVPPAPDNNRPIRNFRPGNTAPTPVTNNTPITNPPSTPPASTPMRQPANNPAMQPPNNNNPGNNKYLPGRPAQPQQTVVPPASNNNNNPPNNRYMPGRPVQQQQQTMKLPPDKTPPANTPPPKPMPAPRDPNKDPNKDLPKKPEPRKDDRNNN